MNIKPLWAKNALLGSVLSAFVSPLQGADPLSYIVQPGDTACEIAELFLVPCAQLIEHNGLGAGHQIFVGQTLRVPGKPPPEAPETPSPVDIPTAAAPTKPSSPTPPPATKIDLVTVYQKAVADDPVFAAASFRRAAAQQTVPITQLAVRPQLSVRSGYTLSTAAAADDNFSLSVSLKQNLYDRSTNIAVNQARNEASIANLEHLIEKQRLLLRVCNAYFSVLAAKDNVELSTSNQRAIRRQLELAEERLAVGVGTRTDLYDARARFENAIAAGIESEKTARDARQALVALVDDENLSALQPLRTDVGLAAPEPNAVEHWVEAALTDNLALRQSALRVYVAEQDISRQRAARFPVLSLNLNGGFDYSSAASDRTSLSVGVSVPLYEGDLVGARVRQAALRHNAVRADLEAHQREVRRLTQNAFYTVNSHLQRVNALAESVRAGENALKAKEEGFSAGLTTNIDVLDAQRDVFAAKRNYLKARYDYILQVLALEQLAGRLDRADLDRFNQWLE